MTAAINLHQSRELDQAEEVYRWILEQYPKCPEALHFLGLLHHQRKQSDEAIRLIEQALLEAPDYADAYNNLGNIYHMQCQLEKAAECYRKTLNLNPGNTSAWNNLGIILKDLEQFDEAIEIFGKAIELMPDNPNFYRNLGNVHRNRGNFSEAVDAYRNTLRLRGYNAEDYDSLASMLYILGQYDEALPVIQQWLAYDPQNPMALHRLAAFNGHRLNKASEEYITTVFDNFASGFDYVLKNLDYKAPSLVAEAVEKLYGLTESKILALDAGCGTGLCGPLVRTYAERLEGVDLSGKMLENAAKRECYDELIQAELVSFITSKKRCYHLIISADTLVYFGDLSPVCQAVAGALKEGGHFVFTVERCDETLDEGFKINPHGRFSHTENYVRNVIACQLKLIDIRPVLLRYEVSQPVNGFLVIATL